MVEPLERGTQPVLRNGQADLLGRDGLDRVRLVEDHEIVLEQITAVRHLVGVGLFVLHVGGGLGMLLGHRRAEQHEKQRVVEHDDLRRVHLPARGLVETAAVRPAGFRRADVRLAAHLRPDGVFRLARQVAERAVGGPQAPVMDLLQRGLLGAGEELVRLLPGAGEAARAEVILPALEQRGLELLVEQLLQDGDVLIDELFLQIDRVRGHDGLALGFQRVHDRRGEVGERFPDARARLDDEVPPVTQRPRHGGGHLLLLRAELEIARLPEQPSEPNMAFTRPGDWPWLLTSVRCACPRRRGRGGRSRCCSVKSRAGRVGLPGPVIEALEAKCGRQSNVR